MTRTRTQTTLTRLAALVANIHGELETVERLLVEQLGYQDALVARKQKLEADRDALYLTLNQFDPELDPTCIGTSNEWLASYGRRRGKQALGRYLKALQDLLSPCPDAL